MGYKASEAIRNNREQGQVEMAIVIGVDVGSLCTKTVILDGEGSILSYDIMRSGHYYQGAAEESIDNALKEAGIKKSAVKYTLGTGYGRSAIAEADAEVTEITCHARGAARLSPGVHTVIDIGGQDSKVIGIGDNNRVTNFVMNDKCAAGTGRFLEVMASALEVDIGEMGELYFASKKKVEVSSMCTVFAESEVISLFAQGHETADIAAGIANSISRRVMGMVGQVGLREKAMMSGGVAKNAGVVRSIEERIETKLFVPEEPQIVGALGAAIIASERV